MRTRAYIASGLLLVVLPTSRSHAAQEYEFFRLSADSLAKSTRIVIRTLWKYHPGSDPSWMQPEFDDSAWEFADSRLQEGDLPRSGWEGEGWFRTRLIVDAALWKKPLVLTVDQAGASEIYLNGTRIYTGDTGVDETSAPSADYRDYTVFTFPAQSEHVLAVRYRNRSAREFFSSGYSAGFFLIIALPDESIEESVGRIRTDSSYQMFFTAMAIAFGMLHLILYTFRRSARSNLYFAIFSFLYAGNIFFDYQIFLASDQFSRLLYLRWHRAIMPCNMAFALLFLYSLFESKIPKQFWIIGAALVVTGILAVLRPNDNFTYLQMSTIAATLEIVRELISSVRARKEGARIVAWGLGVLFLFSSYDTLLDLGLMRPFGDITNGYPIGFLGLLVFISIHLARDFALTDAKLVQRERETKELEIQQRLLEVDNARKTKELEEARQLQLSMLPKTLPNVPHLGIAAYMKTATEVGGDYYDFHVAEDGTLTAVVGDATGHGARAGTMVSITKGLFSELAGLPDILEIFDRYTQAIKAMNLGQLYMGLSVVKITGRLMRASVAGMPLPLIYRAKTKTIEELDLKGMPLGAFSGFPYQVKETELEPGDAILLLSDGLPELFNERKEQYDVSRVRETFMEMADQPPDEIIARLAQAAEQWANGRPQNDDITMVILKMKHPS